MLLRPPVSSLFPYTTLFRSSGPGLCRLGGCCAVADAVVTRACAVSTEYRIADRLLGRVQRARQTDAQVFGRSEEHTSELQSPCNLVCRHLLEKINKIIRCNH